MTDKAFQDYYPDDKEIKGRKVVIESRLISGGNVCATGEVVAVQMPEHMRPGS